MTEIDLVVVPYDSGERGARMGAGPLAFVDAGLADTLRDGGCDVRVTWVDSAHVDPLRSAVELAQRTAAAVNDGRRTGRFPLVLCGNCITTVGAFAGARGPDSALVWFDAHGDLNTPDTSPSGFLDGMAAAALIGWCHADAFDVVPGYAPLDASRLLLVGARALDAPEAHAIDGSAVTLLTPDVARNEATVHGTLDAFLARASDVFLHIDLDVLDPEQHGPANTYAAPGGLVLFDAVRIVQEIAKRRPIAGMTVSAYDPAVDADGRIRDAALPLITEALAGASDSGRRAIVAALRDICAPLPDVTETIDGFGHTTFRVAKKSFVIAGMGDDGFDVSFKSDPVTQAALIRRGPWRRTPYIGQHGWVTITNPLAYDSTEIRERVLDAFRIAAPKRLRRFAEDA